MVVPLTDNVPSATLLGVLLCFRHIVPHVGDTEDGRDTMKGSFGANVPKSSEEENVDFVDESKLLKVLATVLLRIFASFFIDVVDVKAKSLPCSSD